MINITNLTLSFLTNYAMIPLYHFLNKEVTMNNVNKTLYIPLYGKFYVSKKGILLEDKQAEMIWEAEGFTLKSKSKSKWLAYYMGMRSAIFDNWVTEQISKTPDAVVLHIGCGLDSRCLRIQQPVHTWYDIDFPEVISERERFYQPTDTYHMIGIDSRDSALFDLLPTSDSAIIIMEGISMYIQKEELTALLKRLSQHFNNVQLLMDCYTEFAAKVSKYKNPINEVGVTKVYGIDSPLILTENTGFRFIKEHTMTPVSMIKQLSKMEQIIFKPLYGGKISKKMYRLYEYSSSHS